MTSIREERETKFDIMSIVKVDLQKKLIQENKAP